MFSKLLKSMLILVVSVMLFACNSEQKEAEKRQAAQNTADSLARVSAQANEKVVPQEKYTYVEARDMTLNPKGYTYKYDETGNTGKAREVSYTISEVDRPPMFSENCLTKKKPFECSNEALQAYFSKNIEYPDQAERTQSDGLEYVSFTVEPDGSIGQNFSVVTKEKSCKSCAAAAVKAVAAMPKWVPAMKDGKPVRTNLVLPVRFDYDKQ